MLTKLQALELAKQWLDRYREEPAECSECEECGAPVVDKVADDLDREIILERMRERRAHTASQPSGV